MVDRRTALTGLGGNGCSAEMAATSHLRMPARLV